MSYLFSPDTNLMGHKCQHNETCGLEVAFSGCGCKDAAATIEGGVFEAELVISDLDSVYSLGRSRKK